MKKCIYCKKDENETNFNSCEHVIPRLLGSFDNNMTLHNTVCDFCNSTIFNPLETLFKEDTEEGLYFQMFNLQNSAQIRVRNKNTKINIDFDMDEKIFNNIFPLLSLKNNKWQPNILPQIRINSYAKDGYIILLIDKFKNLKRQKFNKLKELLRPYSAKDVSIFVPEIGQKHPFKKAIAILKSLGIDYKHKTKVLSKTTPKTVTFNTTCIINETAARILAKIAFNYFAYCAVKDNKKDFLFSSSFNKIRSYILGSLQLPTKNVILDINNEPITIDEKIENAQNNHIPAHTIVFENINDKIIVRISFLGLKTYTIELGSIPKELKHPNFGSGHMFFPTNKQISPLTQNSQKWKSNSPYIIGLTNTL